MCDRYTDIVPTCDDFCALLSSLKSYSHERSVDIVCSISWLVILFICNMSEEFDHPSLEAYLESLSESSRRVYERNFDLYIDQCGDWSIEAHTTEAVKRYMQSLHDDGYKTSTLWSILSMLSAYFEFGLHIILKSAEPSIKRKLELWEKEDETKKAKVVHFISQLFIASLCFCRHSQRIK